MRCTFHAAGAQWEEFIRLENSIGVFLSTRFCSWYEEEDIDLEEVDCVTSWRDNSSSLDLINCFSEQRLCN